MICDHRSDNFYDENFMGYIYMLEFSDGSFYVGKTTHEVYEYLHINYRINKGRGRPEVIDAIKRDPNFKMSVVAVCNIIRKFNLLESRYIYLFCLMKNRFKLLNRAKGNGYSKNKRLFRMIDMFVARFGKEKAIKNWQW